MYLHETEAEFPVDARRGSILKQVAGGIGRHIPRSTPVSSIPESVAIGPNYNH